MAKFRTASLAVVTLIAVGALSGCDKLEQAANDAVENAKQSAAQALDEARQAGSIEEARQSADRFLLDAKQQAAGLLEQASQYLSESQPVQQDGIEQQEIPAGKSYPDTAPQQ